MATRFVRPIRSLARGRRSLCALALAPLTAALAPIVDSVSANAPPLATTLLPIEALATPDHDAALTATIPQAVEGELTGKTAPGFLGVYYDDQSVWVPAQYLSLGVRPGIDTGLTIADTSLLDAPMRDASVLEIVLEGQTAILTGANVEGYDAAAYDGVGGWIDERDLSR